jgi:hypothetical protein
MFIVCYLDNNNETLIFIYSLLLDIPSIYFYLLYTIDFLSIIILKLLFYSYLIMLHFFFNIYKNRECTCNHQHQNVGMTK